MESRSLAELQRAFTAELRDHPLPAVSPGWRSLVAPGRISPETALSIYRGNTNAVLAGALGEVFPAVRLALGSENFARAAAAFARRFPATRPDLNGYGAEFPEFLRELPGLEPFPFLVPLARLDRVTHDLYYAAGDDDDPDYAYPSIESIFSEIASGDPERTALRLTRPAALFEADFSVHRLRELLLQTEPGADTPELARAAEPGLTRLVVLRRAHDLLVHETSALHWDVLGAIAAGRSVAELDAVFQDNANEIAATLAGMIQAGWIGGVLRK